MILLKKLFFILFCILGAYPTWGQEPTMEEVWIERNRKVSEYFDILAAELDYQLAGSRTDERNTSQLSLIGFAQAAESSGTLNDGHIDVNLHLPAFEEAIKLRLSSFDAEDEFEGLDRNRTNARPQEQKLGTSVAIGQRFSDIEVVFRPRVELRDPLITSFLLKFSNTIKRSVFNFNSQLRFLTHSRDGVGQSLSLYLDTPIAKSSLFRIFTEEQYLDQRNLFSTAHGVMFLEKMSEEISLSQTISLNSQNRNLFGPDTAESFRYRNYHLNNYQFIFSFHHKLYKNVFHYQISPSLNFYKRLSFRGDPAILLRTELIF